ncbi:MAG: hypothetical protein ACYCW6_18420 [Candidatus Xenobia bacterium]
MSTRFLVLTAALAFGLAAFPAIAASPRGDLETINNKVLRPLVVQQLERHYSAVEMNIQRLPSEQQVGTSTTRMTLWSKVQMPDGSLMQVPESFDVRRLQSHAHAGKFNDLSIYQISRAGVTTPEITIGLAPDNQVVLLNGSSPPGQIPSLR